MTNRGRLIELGWKQGILLVPDDASLKENAHYEIQDDARLLDINIESTASITLEDLKGFREWDYSYLSFRDADNSAMPIDV